MQCRLIFPPKSEEQPGFEHVGAVTCHERGSSMEWPRLLLSLQVQMTTTTMTIAAAAKRLQQGQNAYWYKCHASLLLHRMAYAMRS